MNSKDWYLKGKKDGDMEAYKQAIIGEDLWYIDKLNALMQMSTIMLTEDNINEALKYAMLAAICTESPRADVCCRIGDIYFAKDNLTWAKVWYEMARGNITIGSEAEELDEKFFTWYPLLSLSVVEYFLGNIDVAKEYNDAVLLIDPENEIALDNAKKLSIPLGIKGEKGTPETGKW